MTVHRVSRNRWMPAVILICGSFLAGQLYAPARPRYCAGSAGTGI